MNKDEARKYLCDLVAEMINDGVCPISSFTGEGVGGRPDLYHVRRLSRALRTLGHNRAADSVSVWDEPSDNPNE